MEADELLDLIAKTETMLRAARGRDRMPPPDHDQREVSELVGMFEDAEPELEAFLESYHDRPDAFVAAIYARMKRGKEMAAAGELVSLRRLEVTSPPTMLDGEEVNQREFGRFIDWQGKEAGVVYDKGTPGFVKALDRCRRLTDEDIARFKARGLTPDKAMEWALFYKKAAFFTPNNPTAPGRAVLMLTIARRLRALG